MCGKHFAVGINVDPPVLRLFQQLMQVFQIMAGHHDERAFSNVQRDSGGDGVAEGLRVGPIQQFHAAEVDPPEFHNQLQPVADGAFLPKRRKSLVEPFCHLLVLKAQVQGVVGVSGHALHAEKQCGAQ